MAADRRGALLVLLLLLLCASCASQSETEFVCSISSVIDDNSVTHLCSCRPNAALDAVRLPTSIKSASSLSLDLGGCRPRNVGSLYAIDESQFPGGLFASFARLRRLNIVARFAEYGLHFGAVPADAFVGLGLLAELRLEGFEWVRRLDPEAFRPLRALTALTLVGFGQQHLTYDNMTAALGGLASTPLKNLTMDCFRSISNVEKTLPLSMFDIRNVSLESLVFINNDFNSVRGRLSKIPAVQNIRYLEMSMYFLTYSATSFGLDSFFFLKRLEEVKFAFVDRPDYTPGTGNRPRPPENAIETGVLDFDMLAMLAKAMLDPGNKGCYYHIRLPVSASIRRATIHNMDFFKPRYLNEDVCFDSNNNVEYVDLSGCPIAYLPRSFRGFDRIRTYDLRDIQFKNMPTSLFAHSPTLEVLLLAKNPSLGRVLADDVDAELFRPLVNLTTLDLSECDIWRLDPRHLAASTKLVSVDLSANRLGSELNLSMDGLDRLRLLDLSRNRIRMMTEDFRSVLEAVATRVKRSGNGSSLTVDLSANPLSCLCNATVFLQWMQTTKIRLAGVDDYTCLYPDDTLVRVMSANHTQLTQSCSILHTFGNLSRCPCDADVLSGLERVHLSLNDYFCTYANSSTVSLLTALALSANSTDGGSIAPWCVATPYYSTFKFIAPLVVAGVVIVVLVVTSAVLFHRRKTESVQRYISIVMGLLGRQQRPVEPVDAVDVDRDAFVHWHDDDHDLVVDVVIPALKGGGGGTGSGDDGAAALSVVTKDDFVIGAAIVDELMRAIQRSRVVVFILTDRFVVDGWCREALMRAYTYRPQAVLPLVRVGPELVGRCRDDLLLSNVLRTNGPLYYAGGCGVDVDAIRSSLRQRVDCLVELSKNSSRVPLESNRKRLCAKLC